MANAVAHIMIPIILIQIWRHYMIKDKKNFPFHYVFLAGIAGILPDVDMILYGLIRCFKVIDLHVIHRTFTHSLWFPLLFFVLAFVFWNLKWSWLGKHKMTLRNVFIVIGFGVLVHLILDFLVIGQIMPFYPFNDWSMGLNLVGNGDYVVYLDAILLAGWLGYMELKHRISSFF